MLLYSLRIYRFSAFCKVKFIVGVSPVKHVNYLLVKFGKGY